MDWIGSDVTQEWINLRYVRKIYVRKDIDVDWQVVAITEEGYGIIIKIFDTEDEADKYLTELKLNKKEEKE